MECTWPAQSLCSWNLWQRVKEELDRGQELANQLRRVVENGDGGLAEALATSILCSFTNSLSLLTGNHESKEELIPHMQAHTGSTPAAPTVVDSSSWDAHEVIKSTERIVDRTGSYKRRKTSNSWTRDTTDFVDDGHVWRKYGQKVIHNASHPRSYFRCSHKYDQGCKATKQVQKVEDDPCLFRITYFENHTCTHSFLKAPELILDSISSSPREVSDSKFMITFENTNNLTYKQEHPFFSSYSSTEREIIKRNHEASIQSSSCDHLVSGDQLTVFESSELIRGLLKTMEFDHEDMLYYRTMIGYFDQEIFPM